MNQQCPLCGQYDSIKKVSAIIADRTVYTQTVGGAVGSSGGFEINGSRSFSQSLLCQTLTFTPKGNTDVAIAGGVILCISMLLGSVEIWGIADTASRYSPYIDQSGTIGFLVIFGMIVLIGIILGFALLVAPGESKQDKQARTVWETLYYCNRDDIVYIPGPPSRHAPRIQMSSLLY